MKKLHRSKNTLTKFYKITKFYFVLSPALLAITGAPLALAYEPTGVSVDSQIQKIIKSTEAVPNVGTAVIVIEKGHLTFSGVSGFRDRALKLPMTDSSRFVLGSLSKAVTSLAALMISRQQGFSLNEPISKKFPEFILPYSQTDLTWAEALSHQSKLPTHDCLWYLTSYSAGDLAKRIAFLPSTQTAKRFNYSNLLYGTVGSYLARLKGEPLNHFIENGILWPLGMKQSHFHSGQAGQTGQAGQDSKGYWGEIELPKKNTQNISGAAGFEMTLNDAQKWIGFLMESASNPLEFGEWFKPLVAIDQSPTQTQYALGWGVQPIKEFGSNHVGTWIRHWGSMDGYLSFLGFSPETSSALIVLTNQNSTEINQKILDWFFKRQNWHKNAEPQFELYEKNTSALSQNNEQKPGISTIPTGKFLNRAYGELKVSLINGVPNLKLNQHTWPLKSFGGHASIHVDMGGRFADYPVTWDITARKPVIKITFEEKAAPIIFEKFKENLEMVRASLK